ncbi:MAG: isoprenylcysteine carboxylmethyltransferase family protein [Kineosporiaceae bacterium]
MPGLTPVIQSHAAGVALVITVGAFSVGELWQTARVPRGVAPSHLRGEVLFRLVFVGAILLLPLGAAVVPGAVIPGGALAFVVGAVMCWLGLLLRWWCFVTLGRYFTVVVMTRSGQTVVERGPYRVLRHPSYTGFLLALLGFGVMLGNAVGALASCAVVLAALVHRIRFEEHALVAGLGEAYLAFAERRARLVPFIW